MLILRREKEEREKEKKGEGGGVDCIYVGSSAGWYPHPQKSDEIHNFPDLGSSVSTCIHYEEE